MALYLHGCATGSAAKSAATDALTDEDAARIIAAYENRRVLRQADGDPLHRPKSLDDVMEILHRDQIDLFPDGARFAAQAGGVQALALAAQIDLAWGEGQVLLADLLARSSGHLREVERKLTVKERAGALKEPERTRLDKLRTTVSELGQIAEALTRVGGTHIKDGIDIAKRVIDQAPSDYHGYRVAADYYRLRDDWPSFDQMMKKLEELKPDSNGLLFLRGMEALERYGDRERAERWFEKALERDPKFARAEVQLLLAQSTIAGAHEALERLKQISPRHQIVVWAAPVIGAEYDSWQAQEERHRERVQDRMVPDAR
jgi:tetratricopeptide (TPR) repeat protein